MSAVWEAWVPAGQTPARAAVEAKLANPEYKVEIQIVAALQLALRLLLRLTEMVDACIIAFVVPAEVTRQCHPPAGVGPISVFQVWSPAYSQRSDARSPPARE